MKVHIPQPLVAYTDGRTIVESKGGDLMAMTWDLDRQFQGMRFRLVDEQDRIREHMRLFINEERAYSLSEKVDPDDEVHIIAALSGG